MLVKFCAESNRSRVGVSRKVLGVSFIHSINFEYFLCCGKQKELTRDQ